MFLFNRPAGGLLPRFSWPPIMCDNNESNYAALKGRQPQSTKETDTCINIVLLPAGSNVAVQHKDGGPWMHGTSMHGSEHHNRR